MKRTFQALSIDMKRAFGSINFFIAAIGVCIVYYASVWREIFPKANILTLFEYAPVSLGPLIALFCVLPYTTSFCSDWNSQYIRLIAIRTSHRGYGLSKVISCALSSGSAIALGNALFIISLMPRIALVSESSIKSAAAYTVGGEFLLNGQYGMYFAIRIYLAFLAAAFWSVVGLCASSYMPNKFVALCTPFIASFFLNRATSTFPVWLRLNKISEGMCMLKGTWVSLAYATLLYTMLTVAVGLLFVRTAKRRLANG